MKLNFGKKLLLLLHWLLSVLICVLLVLLCVVPNFVRDIAEVANAALGSGITQILSVALLAIYVLISVFALITICSRAKKRGERGLITVDSSDSGKTRIAISAIEQMIRQAVRGVDGIGEMKCAITNNDDSISINTNVTLLSGAHVPTVTMNMQRAIRGYIELNCGVAVREICVNVNSVESTDGGKRASKKNLTAAAPVAQVVEPAAAVSEEPVREEPAFDEADEAAVEPVSEEE